MPKFNNSKQQQVYDNFIQNPPARSVGGLESAYFRGREVQHTVLDHPPYLRDSLAYAAWRAGRKHAITNKVRELGQ